MFKVQVVHLAYSNLVADDLNRLATLGLPLGELSLHTTDIFFQHLCKNKKLKTRRKNKMSRNIQDEDETGDEKEKEE